MKTKWTWRDTTSSILTILGAVVVFAKLQSYSWWLIGSWKGALVIIGIIGLGILLTNIAEIVDLESLASFGEMILWLLAATMALAGLFSATTKAQFVAVAILIGVAWLAQVAEHFWGSVHQSHRSHLAPIH